MNGVAISEKSSPPPLQASPRRRLPPPVPNGALTKHSRRPSSQGSISSMTYAGWKIRRALSRPLVWIIIIFLALIFWWSNTLAGDLQSSEIQSRLKKYLPPEVTKNLKFFPASHHKIHVRPSAGTTFLTTWHVDNMLIGVHSSLADGPQRQTDYESMGLFLVSLTSPDADSMITD